MFINIQKGKDKIYTHTYRTEYFSAMKKNEILPFLIT